MSTDNVLLLALTFASVPLSYQNLKSLSVSQWLRSLVLALGVLVGWSDGDSPAKVTLLAAFSPWEPF